MTNERITDFFIGNLLKEAGIEYTPNGSSLREIQLALKTASKKKSGHVGFPEFVGWSKDFIIVVEDKADVEKQVLYNDKEQQILSEDKSAIINYALNGALHYARVILDKTSFKKIFAFGCSGDKKHHKIQPMYVDAGGYTVLNEVENFKNFSDENIDRYYKEQVLGEIPQETLELEDILKKSSELHEALRNYGQLGDSEKPLVVSAILLALRENSFSINSLNGDTLKTDGQKIYDALSTHITRVEVQPETKKEKILNQFTVIKDRTILNQIDDRLIDKNYKLGKTPLCYFTEFLQKNVVSSAVSNTPEDVLGRFYGEFIRYSGGDGQSLGVVLTPKHITELFCELVDIRPTDVIFDPCCGTGGFLIAAMHYMLEKAYSDEEKEHIQKEQIHGIEIREDMFSIATTNMILRGDGKSNLICDDFLKRDSEKLRENKYTVGFMNPPYSQAKGKDTMHLSEIHFIKHLLDSMDDEARCVVIVPQSTMVGKTKEDKKIKQEILKKHTLEGVITLNKETFYRIGTNPCIAVFTAYKTHPKEKYCKFINFEDDGFVVNKHVGLVETERAKEKRTHLLSCWLHDAPAESKFMVKTTIEADDEWLHSFYYFNDEIPKEEDFEKTMVDYLTFEFNMIIHGKGYLFKEGENC
ncbi:HsdM family class I SAM-dependent methyltransferase [Clostridium kluyveri]|uniref:HsdM family class I SAM-dependent methyltransferase n=1 Tax=Clostridium kluyveri TaxID=1534 RepID=UPI001FA8D5F5|nr:N-6 DNA methylase [Clostridium kluyveri]